MTSVSRPLKPGDLIVTAEPFAYLLKTEMWGLRCHRCLQRSNSLKRCSGCKTFHYCGRDCQVEDWKAVHKLGECQVYQRAKEQPSLGGLLLFTDSLVFQISLRIYLICKKKPGMMDKQYPMIDGSSRSFRDLMTHEEEFAFPIAVTKMQVRAVFSALIPYLDIEFFMECICKYKINSFALYSGTSCIFAGAALYIETSVFNHNCRPNAQFVNMGLKQEIRAIRNIPAGQSICITYTNFEEPRATRRFNLKERYFFDCDCQRCEDGDEADMATIFPQIEKLNERSNDLIPLNGEMDSKTAREVFRLKRRRLDLYRKLYGSGLDTFQTIQLFQLVQSALLMNRTPDDDLFLRRLVPQVRKHIAVTHGSEHPLNRELTMLSSLFF